MDCSHKLPHTLEGLWSEMEWTLHCIANINLLQKYHGGVRIELGFSCTVFTFGMYESVSITFR